MASHHQDGDILKPMVMKARKKGKGVDEYAKEYEMYLTVRTTASLEQGGEQTRTLVCRICDQAVKPRVDRIKEHLESKRHNRKLMRIDMQNKTKNQENKNAQLNEAKTAGKSEMFVGQKASKCAGNRVKTEKPSETNCGSSIEKSQSPPLLTVKWNHFNSNLLSMFSIFRKRNHLLDVTLWCDENSIKCHKLILVTGSKVFEKLLEEHQDPSSHPAILLPGFRFWEIEALVDFMYNGEVNVSSDKIPDFLRAAESLQIRGLESLNEKLGLEEGGMA